MYTPISKHKIHRKRLTHKVAYRLFYTFDYSEISITWVKIRWLSVKTTDEDHEIMGVMSKRHNESSLSLTGTGVLLIKLEHSHAI